MDEYDDFGYGYDEGSDIDNWEDEQVFQDVQAEMREEFEEDYWDEAEAWEAERIEDDHR